MQRLNMKRTLTASLSIGAAVLISLVRQGFDFGIGNNALQLPILQLASNPQLYPDDPFVATLSNYVSGLWQGMAWLSSLVEHWSGVFFWLHVGARLLTAAALYLFIDAILDNRRHATIGAALLIVGPTLFDISPVGKSDVLIGYFNHTEVSLAFALLAFSLAVRERWIACALCAGLAFDLNAFVGAWAAFVLGLVAFWGHPAEHRRSAIERVLTFYSGFAAVAAPVLIWIGMAVGKSNPVLPGFDYRQYLLEYYPYHFLISAADSTSVVELGFVAISGFVALRAIEPYPRPLALLFLGAAILFNLGVVLPFLTGSATLLNLHLLRTDSLIVLFSALSVVGASLQRMSKQDASREERLSAVIPLGGVLTGNWMITAVGLIMLERTSETTSSGGSDRWVGIALLGGGAWALAIGGLPHFGQFRVLTASWLVVVAVLFIVANVRAAAVTGLLVVATFIASAWLMMIGLLAALVWVMPGRNEKWERMVFVVVAIAAGALVVTTNGTFHRIAALALVGISLYGLLPMQRVHEWRASYLGVLAILLLLVPALTRDVWARFERGSWDNLKERELAWRDVQQWAQRETPVDATFIVPLQEQGFGVLAQRGVWVDWKQGAAVMWERSYYPIWKDRMERQRQLKAPEDFIAYAHRQGVPYVVTDSHKKWERYGDARRYSNCCFAVYEVEAAYRRTR